MAVLQFGVLFKDFGTPNGAYTNSIHTQIIDYTT